MAEARAEELGIEYIDWDWDKEEEDAEGEENQDGFVFPYQYKIKNEEDEQKDDDLEEHMYIGTGEKINGRFEIHVGNLITS
jgi:hypothetical protein